MYIGIVLIVISFLILFGFVSGSSLLMLAASISACFFSISDLLVETRFNKKEAVIKILDAAAVVSIIGSIIIPSKSEYDAVLKVTSDFATFLGFSIVILTIGIKNSKSIQKLISKKYKHLKMEQPEIRNLASQLAAAEYNSVIEINTIILELKKCDSAASNLGRIHDGWSLLSDSLSFYDRNNELFYDVALNELFGEFISELKRCSFIFGNISIGESSRKIRNIDMLGIDMEISSFSTSEWESPNDGLEHLAAALIKWNELKKIATDKFEKNR